MRESNNLVARVIFAASSTLYYAEEIIDLSAP